MPSSDADPLRRLVRFSDWAHGRLIAALRTAGLPPEARDEALRLLSHTLRAEHVWLGRVQGTEAAREPFWQTDTLEACDARRARNRDAWLAELDAVDASTPVAYTNSRGEPYTSTIDEIVTHLSHHGAHHRAQIARLLREHGVAPPPMDFIVFARAPES